MEKSITHLLHDPQFLEHQRAINEVKGFLQQADESQAKAKQDFDKAQKVKGDFVPLLKVREDSLKEYLLKYLDSKEKKDG